MLIGLKKQDANAGQMTWGGTCKIETILCSSEATPTKPPSLICDVDENVALETDLECLHSMQNI